MEDEDDPDKDEWADIIFFTLLPPHFLHEIVVSSEKTITSDT